MKNISTYLLLLFFLTAFLSETSAKILPEESIFQLQFNKSLFVSGEKIWIKNSVVSGRENGHQNILFVDLCGEGNIITSKILVRENNHWQGDVTIPDSLETGIYLLRAYTGNYDGRHEMASKLVTIINRFGNNQTNRLRKEDRRNKPLDLINLIPENTGHLLKVYTNSKVYKQKEIIECWIEKQKEELPAGISFSVFKVPDIIIVDSTQLNVVKPEEMVEYASGRSKPIFDKLTLSGKVTDKLSKMAVPDEMVLFSIPDSIPQINYAKTDENGEFRFEMDEYWGQQDIIVQTISKDVKYDIVLLPNLYDPPVKIPFYLDDEIENSEFVKMAVQRSLLQKAYNPEIGSVKQKTQCKYPFYGACEDIVIPDRYIELNDFEEITKELLPLCRIRKEKGNASLKIFDQSKNSNFESPWILVDGIPVYDVKKLFPLNSPKIKRIEIQHQSRSYGDLLIEGIMSVFTTQGGFRDIPLPVNAVRTTIETFYQPTEYSGNLFVDDVNLADFKDVLYWKPMVEQLLDVFKTNVQCSYEKGSYVAIAQTVDREGIVHRSVCRFNVE